MNTTVLHLLFLLWFLLQGNHAVATTLLVDSEEVTKSVLLVKIRSGTLKGSLVGSTRRFLGIPFAAPPVKKLRWKPPQPVKAWAGERPAITPGNKCPQVEDEMWTSHSVSSEDCLFLNVWAPAGGSGYAVMFYIHGGGFLMGDTGDMGIGPLLSGQYLAENQKVIVVSINYRLGALGFLAHRSLAAESPHSISGNYGLMDMIAALKWVRDNIAAFGGDPAKVMIFGHSAGATATCALVASRLAKGLFSSAAVQSGWCGAASMRERLVAGNAVAKELGCNKKTDAETAACLRGRTPDELLTKVGPFNRQYYIFAPWRTSHTLAAGPTVDHHVLQDIPLRVIEKGKHNRVPLIVGSTQDEFEYFISDQFRIITCDDFRKYIIAQFEADADKVLEMYKCPWWNARGASVQAAGDFYFTCPSRRAVRAAASWNDKPVYQYLFSHQFNTPFLPKASHAADIPYAFGTFAEFVTLPSPFWPFDLMHYLANFAKRGDPNGTGLVRWNKYDKSIDNFLNFGTLISERQNLKNGLCNFWDKWGGPF